MRKRIKEVKSTIADLNNILLDGKCKWRKRLLEERLNAKFELAQLIARKIRANLLFIKLPSAV